MKARTYQESLPVMIGFGIVASCVLILLFLFLFFNAYSENTGNLEELYMSEIDLLQKQIQGQLDYAKKSNLSNEEVETIVLNASLASIRLSEARQWAKNGAFVDAQNRLNSAKNWLNENKKILQKGGRA